MGKRRYVHYGFGEGLVRDACLGERVSGTFRVGAGAIADEPRGERVHQRGLDLHLGDLLPAAHRMPRRARPAGGILLFARDATGVGGDGDVQRRRAMVPRRRVRQTEREVVRETVACDRGRARQPRLRLVEEKETMRRKRMIRCCRWKEETSA